MSNKEEPKMDENTGKMINPHNPEYITTVPWYLGNSGPTLKHHHIQKNEHVLTMSETDQIYMEKAKLQKDIRMNTQKGLYKKGACKNCGATTHKEKDCLERPRSAKSSAWKSGIATGADDVVVSLENHGKVSYDAKRDTWQGFDPKSYSEVVDRFNRIEEARQRFIEEEKSKEKEFVSETKNEPKDEDSDYGSDAESDVDESSGDAVKRDYMNTDENARDFQTRIARQGGVGGAQMKVTSRNLRIREDIPKYLRNLDLGSAFYDPKTRSMRDNPFPNENPDNLEYMGDNASRNTGDAMKFTQNQVLCWEMREHGEDLDIIANPSQAELMQKQFLEKKKALEDMRKKNIEEKYGNSSSVSLDPRLRLGQTEAYVEYDRNGRVIKGATVSVEAYKTKYEEDVFINNHTSVWGSYYNRNRRSWGYACCHSLLRNSYCTGLVGREANDAANGNSQSMEGDQIRKMLENKAFSSAKKDHVAQQPSSNSWDNHSKPVLDEAKVKESMEKELNKKKLGNLTIEMDDRKRSYNSMESATVTEEDLEAYRRVKSRGDDPMAKFLEENPDYAH